MSFMWQELPPSPLQMPSRISLRSVFEAASRFPLSLPIAAHFWLLLSSHVDLHFLGVRIYAHCKHVWICGVYIMYIYLPVHVRSVLCVYDVYIVYMYVFCAGGHLDLTTVCSLD